MEGRGDDNQHSNKITDPADNTRNGSANETNILKWIHSGPAEMSPL